MKGFDKLVLQHTKDNIPTSLDLSPVWFQNQQMHRGCLTYPLPSTQYSHTLRIRTATSGCCLLVSAWHLRQFQPWLKYSGQAYHTLGIRYWTSSQTDPRQFWVMVAPPLYYCSTTPGSLNITTLVKQAQRRLLLPTDFRRLNSGAKRYNMDILPSSKWKAYWIFEIDFLP